MKRLRVPDKHGVELAEYTREIVYCLGVEGRERVGGREIERPLARSDVCCHGLALAMG